MYNIHTICDYVIFRLKYEEDQPLNNLKLQKLLYYIQAWHLAFYEKKRFFDSGFQAWIHGPVNRDIYDRFKERTLYSEIKPEDMLDEDSVYKISERDKQHIDTVLESYAKFSGTELEYMTHQEDPWILARKGYRPVERCEREIDDEVMASYYKKRLD